MRSSSTSFTAEQLRKYTTAQRPGAAVLNRHAATTGEEFVQSVKETVVLALNSEYDAVFGVFGLTTQLMRKEAQRALDAIVLLQQPRSTTSTEKPLSKSGASRSVARLLGEVAAGGGERALAPLQTSVDILARTSRLGGVHMIDESADLRLARLRTATRTLRDTMSAIEDLVSRFSAGISHFAELGRLVDTTSAQAVASLSALVGELNDQSGDIPAISAAVATQLLTSRAFRQNHAERKFTETFSVTAGASPRGFVKVALGALPPYGCLPREGDTLWCEGRAVGRVVSYASGVITASGWTLGICTGTLSVEAINAVSFVECSMRLRSALLPIDWWSTAGRDEFFRLLTVNIESGATVDLVQRRLAQLSECVAAVAYWARAYAPALSPTAHSLLQFLKSERMDLVADLLSHAAFVELAYIDASQLSMQTRVETLQRELQSAVSAEQASTQQDGMTAILGVSQSRV